MDELKDRIEALKAEVRILAAYLALRGHDNRKAHIQAMIKKGLLPESWMN